MDIALPVLEELYDDKFWRRVVRRSLDFRDKASREAMQRLTIAFKATGIAVHGFSRSPLSAPTARLMEGVQYFTGNMELMAAVKAIWMESQAELAEKGREYLSHHPPAEKEGKTDVIGIAHAFQLTHPEVQLADCALMVSLLLEANTGAGSRDKPAATGNQNPVGNDKVPKERLNQTLVREREKTRRLEEENRKIQDDLKGKDREISNLLREKRDLNNQIKILKETEEQRVNARIHEIRRKLLLDFSTPLEREGYEGAANEFESAIAFAKVAIDRQVAKNSRLGTIYKVRENYKRVSELLVELGKLKDESILIVPEVDSAIRKLEGIRKLTLSDISLSRILVDRNSEQPVHIDLSWIRNLETKKSSLPVLERISRLIPEFKTSRLLDETGCEAMYDSIRKKMEQIVLKEAVCSIPPPSPSTVSFDDDVRMGRLKGKDLVIDGNNVLLTNLLPEGEKEIPDFSKRRDRLNEKLNGAAHGFRHVYVIYDGIGNFTRTNGNVSVVYTDKQDSNITADDKIAEIIGRLPERIAILATNDGELIDRCPKVYKVLSARDCFDFFMGRGHLGRSVG